MRKIIGVFLIILGQLLWSNSYTTIYEVEPNNTPSEATPFSGEMVVTGLIQKGDQDAFMWNINEEDSLHTWDIELIGVPNALTRIDIMKIIFSSDGKEVEDYQKFFSFGTKTGAKPVHLKHLFFEKGEYLIALSSKSKIESNTEQSYKIIFSKKQKSSEVSREGKKNARNLTNYFRPYLFKNKIAWFYFDIRKDATQKLWTIKGSTTIGHPFEVALEDKKGNTIAETSSNKFGRYQFKDLELDEGRYYLQSKGDKEFVQSGGRVYSTGAIKIDINEIEPNGEYEANVMDYRKTIHGKINKEGDRDNFRFILPKEFEDKIFDIELITDNKDLTFYLYDDQNQLVQENIRESDTMRNLQLSVETPYRLDVKDSYAQHVGTEYSLKISNIRENNGSIEIEPNDNFENASTMALGKTLRGEIKSYEVDCFKFTIDKPNKIWSIDVIGENLESLSLYKNLPSEELLKVADRDIKSLKLNNLLLRPSSYRTCLRGDSSYRLLVKENSLKDLNISAITEVEHEPNQDKHHANRLKFGEKITGYIGNAYNDDFFHFKLKNYEHIKLTLTPPKGGNLNLFLSSDLIETVEYPKEEQVISGLYPPGDYYIRVNFNGNPNHGFYNLKLERQNFFNTNDIEPNNDFNSAQIIPDTFNLKGYADSNYDFYKLPKSITNETNMTISGKNIQGSVALYLNQNSNSINMKWNDINKSYTATIKEPLKAYLRIYTREGERYDYNLSFSNYKAKVLKPLELTSKLEIENKNVATYSEEGQKVKFKLNVESPKDYNLKIETHISDDTWKLAFNKTIALKKGERKSIPFELFIPKNIDETPVVITLKLSNTYGDYKTLSFKIEPIDNIEALNPYRDGSVPPAILGKFNVASLALGSKVIDVNKSKRGYRLDEKTHGKNLLFDDFAHDDLGFCLPNGRKYSDENVTIELAGDKPSEIIGVVLNPNSEYGHKKQLKSFSIALSTDGKNFESVYHGNLGLQSKDYYFAFDKVHVAKYVRLTLHTNQENKRKNYLALGEFKVISNNFNSSQPLNIANPRLGGHVVKASHLLSKLWDRAILTKEIDVKKGVSLSTIDKELSWVVAFKNERIAKITDMVWHEAKKQKKETSIEKVKIMVSLQTPNGPWIEMPEWIKSDTNKSSYHFDTPVWAKYIKFSVANDKKVEYLLPEELQVLEMKSDDSYTSIVAEWGRDNEDSFYEYNQSRKEKKERSVIEGNEKKEDAYKIDMNQTVRGLVSVAKHDEDWYKVTVPQGNNQFELNLLGEKGVDVAYELYDSNNRKIEPTDIKKLPLKHTYRFDVKEGEYHLKVKQPPISVIFVWDNSRSLRPHQSKIFDAVNHYIYQLKPNIDAINLMCMNDNGKFILSNFLDNPIKVEHIYSNFNRKKCTNNETCISSNAEKTLKEVIQKLKNREGTKGVIIITDAIGERDMKLWKILEEVKPKIFSIDVFGNYPAHNYHYANYGGFGSINIYRGMMQSWANVNNGLYSMVNNKDSMFKAINQATHILHQPVYYKLIVQSSYIKPLGDGTLKITQLKPKTTKKIKPKPKKDFAVELILDASGSMLKRINGKRRIAIAREVLIKAVKETIPPKTQVALRVFGHKKADSCRTDLEMRLQPLNVKKTSRIISKINAKNLAKTPIADSLAKVADDLSKVKGKKVVILVTDGEETCDGDPAKEIQTLKDKGVDVRINIVGFAIDNEKLKAQFAEWAKLGNGAYFEANDKKSLDEAIKKALQIPFKVYNKKDELVGSGIVGIDELKLKGGVYRVVVETSPEQIFEEVVVKGEALKEIKLGAEK